MSNNGDNTKDITEKKENLLINKDGYKILTDKFPNESLLSGSIEKNNFFKLIMYKNLITITLLIILFLFYYAPEIVEFKYKKIENYIKYNLAGNLNYVKSNFYKNENPNISIVISTFNGEYYLKPVVRSVQNQNFLNIEIIIVDDGSKDNSVKVIKELMEEDKRIKLITNGINRGTLYTKARGVLNAKGKYVMTLDHDNFYANKYVFSTLYNESEVNNLDLLGFASIVSPVEIKPLEFYNYHETDIIKPPDIKARFLGSNPNEQSGTSVCLYFIKTEPFLNVIKNIGDEIINRNIDAHDDTILTFVLSRTVESLKHRKDIYHINLQWPKENTESLEFQTKVKNEEREKRNCLSYITFTEVLFKFTEDNKIDKKLAEYNFLGWVIKNKKCQNPKVIKNYAINACNLYLNNKYISNNGKKLITSYLNKIK